MARQATVAATFWLVCFANAMPNKDEIGPAMLGHVLSTQTGIGYSGWQHVTDVQGFFNHNNYSTKSVLHHGDVVEGVQTLQADCFHDPISSFPKGIVAMVFCMAMVFGLALACVSATVGAQYIHKGTCAGRLPPIVAIDIVRVTLVANIILKHTAWSWAPLYATSRGLVLLSGFLLFSTSSAKLDRFGLADAAAFSVRRLARLGPAYYIYLICAAAAYSNHLMFRNALDPNIAWPLNALFAQSLTPTSVCGYGWLPFSATGTGWFISVTMLHSLMFPSLFNVIVMYCLSCRSVVCMTAATLLLLWSLQFLKLSSSWSWVVSEHFAPYRLLDFFLGMLAAQFTHVAPRYVLVHKIWRWVLPIVLIFALDFTWLRNYLPVPGDTALAFIWCIVFVASRCVAEQSVEERNEDTENHILWQGFSSHFCDICLKVLARLAYYSYGAFVYQWAANTALNLVWSGRPGWMFFLVPVLSWAIAVPSDHYVEKPIIQAVEVHIRAAPAANKESV